MRMLALYLLIFSQLLSARALAVPIPFSATFPTSAPTPEQRAEYLRQSALAFIDRLERRGHFGMACAVEERTLTVSSVRREIGGLDVKVLPVFVKPKEATRWSAFYEAGSRRVFVNGDSIEDAVFWPNLAFHEVIGLLSYPDDNYELTSAFGLYETIAETAGMAPEAIGEFKGLINSYLRETLCTSYRREYRFVPSDSTAPNDVLIARGPGGGTDIIGGAGDAAAIGLKLEVLTRYAFRYQGRHSLDLLRRLLNLRVELIPSRSEEISFSCRPLEVFVPRHLVTSTDHVSRAKLHALELEIIERVEACAADEGLTP